MWVYFVLESLFCSSWTSIHESGGLNNSISILSIMESIQNIPDSLQEIVNRNEKVVSVEKFKHLYPNGHLMTHQMRRFKYSRDRGLMSYIAE